MNRFLRLHITSALVALLLALPGCEVAFAAEALAPPAIRCQLVRTAHAVPTATSAVTQAAKAAHAGRPAAIVHPLLECRMLPAAESTRSATGTPATTAASVRAARDTQERHRMALARNEAAAAKRRP